MMFRDFLRKLRYAGLAAILGGWLVILVSISRNTWFVFTEHAFSDLGNPLATDPWIFNYGMMLNGFIAVLYGFYLIHISFNKTSTVGGGFMMITGVFLMLIGFFPEGSSNHYFVSVWFFTQADITILAWGLALVRKFEYVKEAIIFSMLSIVGSVVALIFPWPSTATAEAYGIFILNIWVLLMIGLTPYLDDEAHARIQ